MSPSLNWQSGAATGWPPRPAFCEYVSAVGSSNESAVVKDPNSGAFKKLPALASSSSKRSTISLSAGEVEHASSRNAVRSPGLRASACSNKCSTDFRWFTIVLRLRTDVPLNLNERDKEEC